MQASHSSHSDTSKCTICLERAGSASIDGCRHGFCLRCIRKWSHSKNTCPLCRQPFLAIRHENRSYRVKPAVQVSKLREPRPRAFRVPRQVTYFPIILNPIPLYFYYPAPNTGFFSLNYAFQHPQVPNIDPVASLGHFS